MNARLRYKSNANMQMVVNRMPITISSHYKDRLLVHFIKFAGQPTTQFEFEAEFRRFEEEYYDGWPPFLLNPTVQSVMFLVDLDQE